MSEYANKSVLITGANGGLGMETVRHLIGDGFGKIILACRTQVKADATKERLSHETKSKETKLVPVGGFDMLNPDGIAAAVAALPEEEIDVIVLQSGGVIFSDQFEAQSWNNHDVEKTIFQNVIGAHVTLQALKQRRLIAKGGRVVYIGGEGIRGIPGMIEKPAFASAADVRSYIYDHGGGRKYNPMNAIGVSKLAGGWWSQTVAELEAENFDTVWFSPGLTSGTNGLAGAGKVKEFLMGTIGFGIANAFGLAQSPEKGARKNADCVGGKIGTNGDILASPEGKVLGPIVDQKPMNSAITDTHLRQEFWAILQEVVGPYPN